MALHKEKEVLVFVCLFLLMVAGSVDARRLRPNESRGGKGSNNSGAPVTLSINEKYAIMDNGLVQVKLSIPGGDVVGIQYGGLPNLLDPSQKENSRGYWDVFWTTEQINGEYWLHMNKFKVIMQNENQVELSFSTPWNEDSNSIPVNIEKRFVMLKGSSGFYNYLTLDHQGSYPATNISQIRVAYKLHQDKFRYMVISDDIQKYMPRAQEVLSGHRLAYREAMLWTNHTDSGTTTAVEDKYQYAEDMKDQQVHGWVSHDSSIGFWLIKPSTEFYSAGPFKQDLTSHLGPTSLVTFFGGHYGGQTLQIELQSDESWQKVIGPYFVYLNKVTNVGDSYAQLWSDAKNQLQEETKKWPYEFPSSELYAKPSQRGSIRGQLFIRDAAGQANELVSAKSAWVGLAAPGDEGSWQREPKGYQFWVQADETGNFAINGVHEGEYSLFAWVPGFIGEYVHNTNIVVRQGGKTTLGEIIYEPLRNGPTLWEIGIPDRTAAEFFVPDPLQEYINPAFVNSDKNKFRQYGLWDRYTDLYPNQDLVYNVGVSNYKNDWFYAHVPRRISGEVFQQTTWQINFQVEELDILGSYTLRLALASANSAQVQVRFNDFNTWPLFRTGHIGFDNAIARHGIHGFYWLFSVNVPGSSLRYGRNTLYLTQSVAANPFCAVMYDYIRLEGPSRS